MVTGSGAVAPQLLSQQLASGRTVKGGGLASSSATEGAGSGGTRGAPAAFTTPSRAVAASLQVDSKSSQGQMNGPSQNAGGTVGVGASSSGNMAAGDGREKEREESSDAQGDAGGIKHLLGKKRLRQLAAEVDPLAQLHGEAEEALLDIADDFIQSVTAFSCQLARHRKSQTLEAKDVLLHLERCWHMHIPGFASDDIRSLKKTVVTDAHKQRLTAIRKSTAGTSQSMLPLTDNKPAPMPRENGNVGAADDVK